MMRLGRPLTLLGALALMGGRTSAFGQAAPVTIPAGARHFIVLVDSSTGMVKAKSATDPDRKRTALVEAKAKLTSLLFDASHGEPWYRRGIDRISVIQFGIGTGRSGETAMESLKTARLGEDFARRITHAESKMSARRFGFVVSPRIRTHFDVLPWALPLGAYAAAVPGYSVQQTYVLLLTDGRWIDPQTEGRAQLAQGFLSQPARERLTKRIKLFDESIRIVGYKSGSEVWHNQFFGLGDDKIVLAIAKMIPITTDTAAWNILQSRPLKGLRIVQEGSLLQSSFQPSSSLQGVKGTFQLRSGTNLVSKDFVLAKDQKLELTDIGGWRALATLTIHQTASNPYLGKQQFLINVSTGVALPAGTRFLWFVASLFGIVLVVCGAGWVYHQAVLARHLQLWLPGYVSSFRLPPLSQRVNSRHVIRIPIEVGDVAAILVLPPLLIRHLFYRGATLHWDARLRIPAVPAGVVSARLSDLPAVTKFMCLDRTYAAGEFVLIIERNSKNSRNQRAQINVRFLSLPKPSRPPIEKP